MVMRRRERNPQPEMELNQAEEMKEPPISRRRETNEQLEIQKPIEIFYFMWYNKKRYIELLYELIII